MMRAAGVGWAWWVGYGWGGEGWIRFDYRPTQPWGVAGTQWRSFIMRDQHHNDIKTDLAAYNSFH